MVTIDKISKGELEVEHSTFLSFLYPIASEEDAKEILLKTRSDHPKARHVCYAYCLNGNYKSSDDGEPKGTAGRPLQDLLAKKELNNCLLIVVRYFGGILLGAGRLLRTYVEAGTTAIDCAILLDEIDCYVYEVVINPNQYNNLKAYCSNNDIILQNTVFDERIKTEFITKSDNIDNVKNFFNGKIDIVFKAKKKMLIKK